jgi:hypothetical protein
LSEGYTRLPLLTPLKTDGSKFDFTTQDGAVLSVVSFIKMIGDALKLHECILRFTQSRDNAEDLAALLGCGYYDRKLDETARWTTTVGGQF